ncbi:hypothetical protein [Plantactinospora sp. BB1]|uniref:hypothetical protein n=1 Tax=Plantactinospora sp. BB1 TaxID=2071627 RepID=UPI000D152DD1|nr:hypothetical protein [Plantactinospora sp. BB1]AVT36137.1 hypothetical protein C6W10_06285 [Plantactinospora sp. BB1]
MEIVTSPHRGDPSVPSGRPGRQRPPATSTPADPGGADTRPVRPPPVRTRLVRLLQRYPVSVLLLAPYLILVLPMAVLNRNPDLGFVLGLLGLALAASVLVETVLAPLGGPGRRRTARDTGRRTLAEANSGYPRLFLVARAVAVLSIVAELVGGYAGRGSVFAQVAGAQAASPLVNVVALVSGWKYLAFALLIASFHAGQARLGSLYRWTAALVGVQVLLVFLTAISATLVGYLTFVAAAGAICGVIRARYVLVAAVLLFLAWPTLFTVRNTIRAENGVKVSSEVTAADRLRFDQQIGRASAYDVPVDVGQPGPAGYLRYGLVPRILDPGRPPLATGAAINRFLGGSDKSSFNFLTLGTVYFVDGRAGVVVYYGGWALVTGLLLRLRGAPGPLRLSLFCFVVAGPLLWSNGHPESTIAAAQNTVSAAPVFLVLLLTRRTPVDRPVPARPPGRVPVPRAGRPAR